MRLTFSIFGNPDSQPDLSRIKNTIKIQKKTGHLKPGTKAAVLLEDCGLCGKKGDAVLVRDDYPGRYEVHTVVDLPWHQNAVIECNKDRVTPVFCSTPIVGVPMSKLRVLKGKHIDRLFQ